MDIQNKETENAALEQQWNAAVDQGDISMFHTLSILLGKTPEEMKKSTPSLLEHALQVAEAEKSMWERIGTVAGCLANSGDPKAKEAGSLLRSVTGQFFEMHNKSRASLHQTTKLLQLKR